MTELKLYKSNSKGFKILAMSLPFVSIGIWMIAENHNGTFDFYMGWFITSFFGLGILIIIFNFLDKRPQIVIYENGIWNRTTKQNEIKWEQIKECYLIDIYNQKFISIVTNETFALKKNTFSWLNKLNKYVAAQEMNINLGLINIDENKLTDFINNIRLSEKSLRNNQIKNFNSNLTMKKVSNTQKYIANLLILICLLIASFSNLYAFWVMMITMGIGGFIGKWFRGTNNNSNLRKYAFRIVYLGFTNMVLYLLIIKCYEYTTKNIGTKLTNEIENYKTKNGNYPHEIKTLNKKLNLNLFEKYIVDKIDYKKTDKEYMLELMFLNQNLKEFDKEHKEWD
ncbi:hypothetical protein B0A58_16110 [Flavobacterium branchiophilum NBRC 15030 = ATCC 35035]|uniref:Uncharacterized protein n=1 Tax=Flavobacterium branchiophilum TaxID=55197 RepID=A0A543G7B7_9FLAO|nr:STM3941 family protein [Flavobacterium branchiophilum]OXA65449.1 hypothetical protein B0A58_16110 [Flavobacterium branchiophilum NBRC 15030 = ATCC 35035]TQM41978.1 hypothetical protein BC670_2997 [Flavobacterium branchiophilum]GEM55714.1 hypothetical protein FB1_19350 [Flavobacterium branchiophilum NBRC 15030 = ATCC 35035]